MRSEWSAERIERLRQLWNIEKHTAQRCADILNAENPSLKLTLNSIICKAHRIGLDARRKTGRAYKPRDKKDHSGGVQIAVPHGYKSISEAVRDGIEWERGGALKKDVAKKLGLGRDTYSIARDIVLLSMRGDISQSEKKVVSVALAQLDERRQLRTPSAIKHIALRVWGAQYKRRHKVDAEKLAKFASAVAFVRTTCTVTADLNIPYISDEQRKPIMAELEEAQSGLCALIKRLKTGEPNGST